MGDKIREEHMPPFEFRGAYAPLALKLCTPLQIFAFTKIFVNIVVLFFIIFEKISLYGLMVNGGSELKKDCYRYILEFFAFLTKFATMQEVH